MNKKIASAVASAALLTAFQFGSAWACERPGCYSDPDLGAAKELACEGRGCYSDPDLGAAKELACDRSDCYSDPDLGAAKEQACIDCKAPPKGEGRAALSATAGELACIDCKTEPPKGRGRASNKLSSQAVPS